jgi:ATP-dependent DNA helicase RecQ
VPDFAGRLAERLALPFVAAVSKVRDNEPQKLQQNRFHQDGQFPLVERRAASFHHVLPTLTRL